MRPASSVRAGSYDQGSVPCPFSEAKNSKPGLLSAGNSLYLNKRPLYSDLQNPRGIHTHTHPHAARKHTHNSHSLDRIFVEPTHSRKIRPPKMSVRVRAPRSAGVAARVGDREAGPCEWRTWFLTLSRADPPGRFQPRVPRVFRAVDAASFGGTSAVEVADAPRGAGAHGSTRGTPGGHGGPAAVTREAAGPALVRAAEIITPTGRRATGRGAVPAPHPGAWHVPARRTLIAVSTPSRRRGHKGPAGSLSFGSLLFVGGAGCNHNRNFPNPHLP